MNEKEEKSKVLKVKRKRRRAKRMSEKRKKKAARQSRADNRERRVVDAAQQMIDEKIAKGELVKRKLAEQNTSERKRAGAMIEDVSATKLAKTVAMLREVESKYLLVKGKHLGSGSYGSCNLATYIKYHGDHKEKVSLKASALRKKTIADPVV